jgi:ADP-heptose:LPS heptosyltransferase/glycosyltransferase involved in cell wall biosynthesis
MKRIIKKVGIQKGISQSWFDMLVKNSMMLPSILRRIATLEEKVYKLEIGDKKRILVWRNSGGLGDIVMQSAIARELKIIDSNIYIVYQVPERYLSIPKHNPYVDETQISNIPFIGDGYDKVIKLSDPCPASIYETKRKDIARSRIDLFLIAAGIDTKNKKLEYKITQEERDWAKDFINKNTYLYNKKIGIGIRSYDKKRDWNKWDKLVKLYKDTTIFAFDHDPKMDSIKGTVSVFGFPLEKVAAIIEQLDLIIGPDSGLLHLAGAIGTRVLGLFGPTNPFMRLNTYASDWICLDNCKKQFCWYNYCGNIKCINKISPKMVYNKSIKMIKCINNKTITIKRKGGIGDILMLTPVISEIRRKNPNTTIYFDTIYPEVLECNPDISVIGNNDNSDIVIDFNRSVETKMVGGGILEEEISEKNNRIDLFFKHVNMKIPENPKTKYFLKKNEVEEASKLLEKSGVKETNILIGYAGIPVAHRRAYPLKLARELFDLLLENPEVKIILLGSGARSFVQEDKVMLSQNSRIINLIDQTGIREVAAIMSHCRLVIACDSGLLHIANALDIPNIGLFGTIDPWLRTKYYPLCKTIFPKGRLDCIPCNDQGKACKGWSRIEKYHTLGGECMWQITPEEIKDATFKHIKNTKRPKLTVIKKQEEIIKATNIDDMINKLNLPKNEWKILFPVASIEPNHYAGGLVHIWGVVHALLANGFHVVVVTAYDPLFDRDFEDYPNRDNLHIIIDENSGKEITDKSFCFDYVMGIQPCGGIAVEIAKKFYVPSYLWLFDPPNFAEKHKKIKPDIKGKWENYGFSLEQADHIIISIDEVKKWVMEWIHCNPRKIITLYPCVNSIVADKVVTTKKENEVVFLGRITPSKHPEVLFTALKGLKNKPLINFIGPVDTESDLILQFQKLSKEIKIKYKIYERVSDKEKFEILARSRLLIYPSAYEAFGLPPLEADYVKTPSVVYDLPSYKEWGNFETVPINDTKSLAKTTKKMLTYKQKCRDMKDFASFYRLKKDIGKIIPMFRPSVIMTIYNEEEYIEYALKSIYDWAWEIIIVEGIVENMFKVTGHVHSTDNTEYIINNFIDKYDKEGKIKYTRYDKVFKDKKELQNEACSKITGNIFFKLDGDEIYKKEHLDLLKMAFVEDPNLDLIYFTTLNFWTSFKLVTKGMSWDAPHFKICRWHPWLRYAKDHSTMYDSKKQSDYIWRRPNIYKSIFMPEIVNFHFGWCKRSNNINNKLQFVKNRSSDGRNDMYDKGVKENIYNIWNPGQWANPYENDTGLVFPFYGTLPEALKGHPYMNVKDVRNIK